MRDYYKVNRFQTFCEYVIWFLLGNIYFLICNLPLILFSLLIGIKYINSSLILFGLCLIPLGPSLSALFYSMSKIVKNKDVDITKAFFSSYIKNFIQSITLASTQVLLIMVLYVNIHAFGKLSFGFIFIPFFYIMSALLLVLSFYLYPLISRFYMKTVDILKLSFVLIFANPLITLGNIVIILFSFVLIDIKPSYASLFVISITCFLMAIFEEPMLQELESQSKSINISK